VTIDRRERSLRSLAFISPDKDFAAGRAAFEQMLKSLQLR
jgi:hypothetical protein